VQDGVTKGLAAAAQAVAGCQGKTKLVLLGYSQGAIVARDVAQQAPAGTVGAVFLLGDPDQEPGADGVQGGGASGQGIVRALFGTGTDTYYALPIVRFSFCHSGDPICQFTPAGLADPAGGTAHASYGSDPAELSTLAQVLTSIARTAAGLPASQPG
jgi:pimeloyl-ACP methyl ester carboxylesterase